MKTFMQYIENWRNVSSFQDFIPNKTPEKLFGWLSPKWVFYRTQKTFGHFDLIKNTPALFAIIPKDLQEKYKELEDSHKYSKMQIDKGEHPYWHTYEMLRDSLEINAYKALYKKGCLRVATHEDEVFFKGTSKAIRNLYNKAKDLAESYDLKAKFEKVSDDWLYDKDEDEYW